MSVAALYGDGIRERWRRPRFRGDLSDANRQAEDVNPLCGDRVRLLVRVADGRVQAARHLGDACAICVASADVVAELIIGRTAAGAAIPSADEVLTALRATVRPSRVRCLTLPLDVARRALEG